MKYALIALIAIYLVTYGCSPDNSEEATDSHEQAAPVTLEMPPQSEEVAAHAEQKQTADAAEKAVIVEETTVAAEVTEEAVVATEVVEEPAVATEAVEEPAVATEVVEEPAVATEVVEEPAVEGAAVATAEQAQAVVEEKQTATKEEQPAEIAESQLVAMPCGRKMARADIPPNAPCLKMQPTAAETTRNEQDLAAAMQRMIETSNEMVMATKQLLIATQEILNASKEASEAKQE